MNNRLIFDENVDIFDECRPGYVEELFEDIIKYSDIDCNKQVVEVGIGTGKATEPFLRTGCSLTAIEVGKNLADFSRNKFKEYQNLKVVNDSFEEFECENNNVDLIFSATAFHWIPEEIGYTKAYNLLKKNGSIGLFWNSPFLYRENDELHQQIYSIYKRFRLAPKQKPMEIDDVRYDKIKSMMQFYGFHKIEFKLYHNIRHFDAVGYIKLAEPEHRKLPFNFRIKLEYEIEKAILEHGNNIKVYDTIDLYLGKK